jgi:DNA topoisomerase-2
MSEGKRLNAFQHIAQRSETYISSIITENRSVYIIDDLGIVQFVTIPFNEGLYNIIREIGSNCIDNNWRSKEAGMVMSYIKVTFNTETWEVTFTNDGFFISADKKSYDYEDHRTGKITTEKMYPAELYFGDTMTSTNYDDTAVRKTSGKNGLGSKCTVVFSKTFTVEHTDPVVGKKFIQTFSDNGKNRTQPKLTAFSGKNGWTKISFIPDYEKFGYDMEDTSMRLHLIDTIRAYAAEIAAVSGVPTTFTLDDGTPRKFAIPTFDKYTRMFYPEVKSHKMGSIKLPNGDECVVIESHPNETIEDEMSECQHISFVNGIRTNEGGMHVSAWRDTIISSFVRAFNARPAKNGKTSLKTTAKKTFPYLTFFIRTEVDKPHFGSQTKQKLTGRLVTKGTKQEVVSDYKVVPPAKLEGARVKETIDDLVDKMLKWNFIKTLEAKLSGRPVAALQKIPLSKKITDCANAKEGKPGSTLWISEGLSPKALIVNGVSTIDDRALDSNGIFAIQGKFLNVRKALQKDIDKNEEINMLKSLVGLWSTAVDFTKEENFKKLRYHHIRLATDMDDDGIHIRGLLINFFHYLYPTLLKVKGFLDSFSTAAVKVNIKGEAEPRLFYSPLEYKKWYDLYTATPDFDPAIMDAKYLKGLAAINDEDIPMYFINQKVVRFRLEGDEEEYMDLGFGKTTGNASKMERRKAWIVRDIQPYQDRVTDVTDVNNTSSDEGQSESNNEDDDSFVYDGKYGISTFIDRQLVIYHRMALNRALPNEDDGLKESQRKILYAIMKMSGNKTKDLEKVIGYIKSVSEYHHGGVSVSGAIANMATRYPGDNNIPYLKNDGQFATRLLGPSEFGADRYLHTHYEPIMKDIFMDVDKPLLEILICDNKPAEYRHFIPVIHMLAVNGSQGIASGYSTTIPAHNPDDILDYQLAWLAGTHKDLPPLKPWYRGITGKIELIKDKKNGMRKWSTEGVLTECIGKGCPIRIGKKKSKCHGKPGWWHITDLPVGLWSDTFEKELAEMSEVGKDVKGNKIPKKISKFHNYCTSNTVHFMIKPAGDWIPDMDTTLKMMKTTHSLNNMVTIDRNHYPTTHKTVEDMIDKWMPRRLDFYGKRKQYLLDLYAHDKLIASNRYIFVKAVAEKKLDMHRPKAEVEKDIIKMGLKKMILKDVNPTQEEEDENDDSKKKKKSEPTYKYLYSMNIMSLTREKLEKLKKEIDVNQKRIDELEVISPADLWRQDMNKLRKSWKSFVEHNPLI